MKTVKRKILFLNVFKQIKFQSYGTITSQAFQTIVKNDFLFWY